jgi:hypothetical protein
MHRLIGFTRFVVVVWEVLLSGGPGAAEDINMDPGGTVE